FAQERNAKHGAIAPKCDKSVQLVGSILAEIADVDDLLLDERSTDDRSSPGLDGDFLEVSLVFQIFLAPTCDAVTCGKTKRAILGQPDVCYLGLTKACRGFRHSLEDVLQIKGRSTDELEHPGRCGLPLQRVVEIAPDLLIDIRRVSIAAGGYFAQIGGARLVSPPCRPADFFTPLHRLRPRPMTTPDVDYSLVDCLVTQ